MLLYLSVDFELCSFCFLRSFVGCERFYVSLGSKYYGFHVLATIV